MFLRPPWMEFAVFTARCLTTSSHCRHVSHSHITDVAFRLFIDMFNNVRKDGVLLSACGIPERTQEGLAPLACPHPGEDSRERGWELLRRSTMKQTDKQREVHFKVQVVGQKDLFKGPQCRIYMGTNEGRLSEGHNIVKVSGGLLKNLPPGGSMQKRSN